jgi:hypothetical protein
MKNEFDPFEQAAAELIAQAKRLKAFEFALPVLDQSSVWLVTIKRMGIYDKDLNQG